MEASANGGRVLFTRDLGNIVMDLDDVEAIDANALGGTDNVDRQRPVRHRRRRSSTRPGGPGGGDDLAADNVIVNATNGDDVAIVAGNAAPGTPVLGLAARCRCPARSPAATG